MDSDRASQLSGHAELLDPTRRRRRPPLSCLVCRRRKLKCDRSLPCAQCVKSKSVDSCTYLGTQAGSGSTRRSDTPPRSGFGVTGRTNPSGLHVFDSKREPLPSPKNTSTHLPELQELQELRSRVQTLENALCAPWAIPTPETWGGDGYSGVVPCVAPEDELIREHIDAAPEKYFRGRNSRTRVVGRCHWTLSISFVRRLPSA